MLVQISRECTPPYLSTGISNLLQPAQAEVVLRHLSTYLASWVCLVYNIHFVRRVLYICTVNPVEVIYIVFYCDILYIGKYAGHEVLSMDFVFSGFWYNNL